MQEDFNTIPPIWSAELERDFAIIAMARYPNEAVAILLDGTLIEVTNISSNPQSSFEIDLDDNQLDSLQAIIHSHPDGDIRPSKSDFSTYLYLGVPSGIVSCTSDSCSNSYWLHEGLLDITLYGRPFIHAYYDCYSLIRAYYKQELNILLDDHPREDDWWNDGEDLYNSLFSTTGFVLVNSTEPLVKGDLIFMSINSSVPNHAAVYLGDDNILHHLYGRISRVDKLSVWAKMVDKVVRYND